MGDRKMINKETYKRLTANGEKINIHANLQLAQIYNRLVELEDKIMDGTLVDIGSYELQENKK